MWSFAKQGWHTARNSRYLLLLLFVYQFLSGSLLYYAVKSTVVPILYRYPDDTMADTAVRHFVMESQFYLMKTDMITPYVWGLGLFVLLRMLLTPIINSGLYPAIIHRDGDSRKAFFRGVKTNAKPFSILYLLQNVFIVPPLVWLGSKVFAALMELNDDLSVFLTLLPYIFGWFVYQGLVKLAFMYMNFGVIDGIRSSSAVRHWFRQSFGSIRLALVIAAIATMVGVLITTVSLFWAGLFAVILQLTYPLIRTLFKLWSISAQAHLWTACIRNK
jgi:hypothetical protein